MDGRRPNPEGGRRPNPQDGRRPNPEHKRRSVGQKMTVIFKALNRCNGDCPYCSARSDRTGAIATQDLPLLTENLAELIAVRGIKHLTFTFHGGEPTLLDPELIDSMCRAMRQIVASVSFNMQSNLLSVSDSFIETINTHEIKVGSSFDPLSGLRTFGGQDAYPRWRENFVRLTSKGIAPGAIFVFNRGAMGRESELYEVAEQLGEEIGQRFGLQVNHLYPQGGARTCDDSFVEPAAFGQFLTELWQLWENGGRRITLTPIQQFVDNIMAGAERPSGLSCSFSGGCTATHVGIDWDLNVSSCGRGLDSRSFFGTLREQSLVEVLANSRDRRRLEMREEVLLGGECGRCRFFALCHGGCPDDAMLTSGSPLRRVSQCEGYRLFFEAVEKRSGRRVRASSRMKRVERRRPRIEAISPIVNPADIRSLGGIEQREIWLLPTADNGALRYDSSLAENTQSVQKLRIWVLNQQVRLLTMWRDLLARPAVGIVLFEVPQLEEAVALLGGLRVNVEVDCAALIEADGGAAALEGLVERFLFDNDWAVRIWPFARMLKAAVEGERIPLATRFGFSPAMRLEPGRSTASVSDRAAAIMSELRSTLSLSPEEFFRSRKACLDCDQLAHCGGCFALGDERPCPDVGRRIAARIADAAKEIRARLKSNDKPSVKSAAQGEP